MTMHSLEPRGILIDVSRLIWRYWTRRLPTGIDRVCLAYLEHFGERAQAVLQHAGQYFILSPSQSDRLFHLLLAGGPATRFGLLQCLAMSALGLGRAPHRPDLIYLNVGHTGLDEPTLSHWIRRNRLRAVYFVHDLIPLTDPEFCRPGEGARHAQRMNHVLGSAAGIVANSQATLDELRGYALANGKTLAPAVAAWISGPPPHIGAGEPPLSTPYFVILGTVEGRKNHKLALDIWKNLVTERGGKAPTLVVIGQRGWQADAVFAQLDRPADFAGRLLVIDRCGDRELARWVGGACALLMPSFAEGFGLPVVEALQLGTPVIASDLPVFREIAGGIPTFLNPADSAGWKSAIEAFVDGCPERTRQLTAMSSFGAPSWAAHFAIVDRWLEALSTCAPRGSTKRIGLK